MIVTKKRGRPKEFNKNSALEAAIQVFWKKGYDGASMSDLSKAMGINGPSIYGTFGNKENLYKQAINAYTSNDACAPLVAFESEPDIKLAVKAFMDAAIKYSTERGDSAKGCFLSSCVATSSGEVEGIQPLLKSAIEETDKRLAARFDIEKEKGRLPKDFPSLERAKLMFDLRQGFVLRARAGISRKSMIQDLDQRTAAILGL